MSEAQGTRSEKGAPLWLRAVPNTLTVFRILLACWFPFAPLDWRLWLVLIAGFSDLADGYIARRFNASSFIGGVLDAIADKVFTLVVLISLAAQGDLLWWQTLLLLFRDIALVGGVLVLLATRQMKRLQGKHSRQPGRVATVLLFAVLVSVLAWPEQVWLFWSLFIPTVLLQVVASWDYMRDTYGFTVKSDEKTRRAD